MVLVAVLGEINREDGLVPGDEVKDLLGGLAGAVVLGQAGEVF